MSKMNIYVVGTRSHTVALLPLFPLMLMAKMAVNQREFDEDIRVNLVFVDNTARRSSSHY